MSQPDPRAVPSGPAPAAAPARSVLTRVASLGPLLGLLALMVVATLLNHDFLTVANLSNVLTRAAFSGIIAVGMTFVIISGGIDLSVGSMAALIAGSMILIMNALSTTLGPGVLTIALGMLAALAIGALAGLFHGTVITRGRIEPFIVTLGTLGIYRAVLTYLAQGGAISLDQGVGDRYGPVYYGSVLGIPIPILVFTAVALLGGLILNRTRYGRYVQAIGSSEQVARYAAIDVTGIKILTYVLLGVCVGLATILYVPRLVHRSAVGAGSHRGRHHRRHRPEGGLRAHLGHGGGRYPAGDHRERPEPHQHHLRVPERGRHRLRHHRRRVLPAWPPLKGVP